MGTNTTHLATAWPRVEVQIGADGSGSVVIAGVITQLSGSDAAASRAIALAQLRDLANRLGRPVTATTTVPEGQFAIAVEANGRVTPLDDVVAPRRWTGRHVPAAQSASIPDQTMPAATAPQPEGAGQVSPDQDPAPSTSRSVAATAPVPGSSVIGDRHRQVPEPVADVAPEPVADVAPEPVADAAPEPVADAAPEPVADAAPEPVADAAPGTWLRRRTLTTATVAVTVAALLAGGGFWMHGRAQRSAAVMADTIAAVEDLVRVRRLLVEARDEAQLAIEEVSDQVADVALVGHLLELVAAVPALLTMATPALEDDADVADLHEVGAAFRVVLKATSALADDLTEATSAVRDSHKEWEHAEAVASSAEASRDVQAAIDTAGPILEGSSGRVDDDAVRQHLAEAITAAQRVRDDLAGVGAGSTTAELRRGIDDLRTATKSVQDASTMVLAAQATWEQAAASARNRTPARSAEAPAGTGSNAGAAPGTGGAAPTGTGQQTGDAAAPATSKSINPGAVSSSSTTRGRLTVSATTVGVSGAVVVSVAGVSAQIGTGSGTFTYTFEGLPAGTHAWSVTADGLVAHGSKATVF